MKHLLYCKRVALAIISCLLLTSGFSCGSSASVPRHSTFMSKYAADIRISSEKLNPQPLYSNRYISSLRVRSLHLLRGGVIDRLQAPSSSTSTTALHTVITSPETLFNTLFGALAGSSVVWKLFDVVKSTFSSSDNKPKKVLSLQTRFLVVFWLLRMADWMQGPYFYEVYSSKMINGMPVALDMVSKLFLVGFATTGLCGPFIGRIVDQRGRRLGTFLYAIFYALSALSTQSSSLLVLALGRIAGGLGTSLLFTAPEAWLVSEHQKEGYDGRWLGQTFGWAYSGDALVAITAGQIASVSAATQGPTGPFLTSIAFLAIGSMLAVLTWKENTAAKQVDTQIVTAEENITAKKQSGIATAMKAIMDDKRILLVGAVQALFEGAMYIFVLQWPPMIKQAIQAVPWTASLGVGVPYGKIFSCLMACCLLGSSAFNDLQRWGVAAEYSGAVMLSLATIAMGVATMLSGGMISLPMIGSITGMHALAGIIASFFLFELSVGMYFPSIWLLRSKYIPDSNRSVIMNLFGLPLNLIVVSVFLSIKSLGVQGALGIATASLGLATTLMIALSTYTTSKSNASDLII